MIPPRDDGFTLIELLVTMFLFAILSTVLFTVVMNSAFTAKTMRQNTDLNEESRVVLNRMSRELREAQSIAAVTNPDGPSYSPGADVAVTFDVDFNGNGVVEPDNPDPERLTYTWAASSKRLVLTATGFSAPILANNVEAFKFTYTSRRYECDANSDGLVTWVELDSAQSPCPDNIGNSNGILDSELVAVNSITIEFTVLTGSRRQEYRTQLDLRNRAV